MKIEVTNEAKQRRIKAIEVLKDESPATLKGCTAMKSYRSQSNHPRQTSSSPLDGVALAAHFLPTIKATLETKVSTSGQNATVEVAAIAKCRVLDFKRYAHTSLNNANETRECASLGAFVVGSLNL